MLKRFIAEVLGTFVLVFIGTTTAVLTGGNLLATALAFGMALTAIIYALGGISGSIFKHNMKKRIANKYLQNYVKKINKEYEVND